MPAAAGAGAAQSSYAALLSTFRQQTNLAQLHHTGGGEVALLAVLPPPKPPLLLVFGQHQDDITQGQLQLVWPVGPVAVHHHHLMDRWRVTAWYELSQILQDAPSNLYTHSKIRCGLLLCFCFVQIQRCSSVSKCCLRSTGQTQWRGLCVRTRRLTAVQ